MRCQLSLFICIFFLFLITNATANGYRLSLSTTKQPYNAQFDKGLNVYTCAVRWHVCNKYVYMYSIRIYTYKTKVHEDMMLMMPLQNLKNNGTTQNQQCPPDALYNTFAIV